MNHVEIFGNGTMEMLGDNIKRYGAKKIFLVTAELPYVDSGAKKVVDALGLDIKIYKDFQENPKFEDVLKGVEKLDDAELIVSIGGGSCMDMAKLVNLLQYAKDPKAVITNDEPISKKGLPHIAIPTTAGTGSQSTHFAVVYIGKKKYSVAHEYVMPDVSIIDPELTLKLPKKITADTGMDALTQAIESYWCINSNDESKEYARKAIQLVMDNLDNAVNHPDMKAREAMAKASNLAGKAINISKTTASHSISYPITSYYGVAHGHACALTIGQMLIYNSTVKEDDLLDARGVEYVKKTTEELVDMLGGKDAADAAKNIENLMQKSGLATRFSELGIMEFEMIVEHGFNPDRVKNNPRKLTERALREILERLR